MNSQSKNMARPWLALLVALVALSALGCQNSPVKRVAAIDERQIYEMDQFKKAQDELKSWIDSESKKRQAEAEAEGVTDEKKAMMKRQFTLDVQKKSNELLHPLKQKAAGAVAKVAREKGALVVLDNKIVVYGVEDMTEEVKKVLESGQEITLPEEDDTAEAPVGYFDQAVVRSLKVFQEVDLEIAEERNRLILELKKQIDAAEQQPSPTEMQAVQRNMALKLEAFQEQKMAPLLKAVNDSVEEVAQAEGLSLVLDKQHVMYGGRNMTEEVVDTFLKKVNKAQSAPTDGPQANATNEGGE